MKASRNSFAAALALFALGCGSQGGGSGKVTVLLKDAAADVRAAFVTIAEVDLVGNDGVVVLTTTPVTTNLLTLANDVTALVKDAAVPAGPYSQLRFVITGGYLDVAGAIYASSPTYQGLPPNATVAGPLRMPSYAQSGLKVILPDGFTVGSDSVLVVDFDVARSFGHDAGGSGAWVMHPVIKATVPEATGAIAVTLALGPDAIMPTGYALTDFPVVLAPHGGSANPSQTMEVLAEGLVGWTYPFLAPGLYDVSFLAPDDKITFEIVPEIPAVETVVAGQTTQAGFILKSVTLLE